MGNYNPPLPNFIKIGVGTRTAPICTVLFEAIPTLLKTTSDLLQTYYRVVFPEFKTGAKCTVWGQDNVTGNGKLAEWAALRYSISCASQ